MKLTDAMHWLLRRSWPMGADLSAWAPFRGFQWRTAQAMERRGLVLAITREGIVGLALTAAGVAAHTAVMALVPVECTLCRQRRRNASLSTTHPACAECLARANVLAAREAVHGPLEPCEECDGAGGVEVPSECDCGEGCGCKVLRKGTTWKACKPCGGIGWVLPDGAPLPVDDGPVFAAVQ